MRAVRLALCAGCLALLGCDGSVLIGRLPDTGDHDAMDSDAALERDAAVGLDAAPSTGDAAVADDAGTGDGSVADAAVDGAVVDAGAVDAGVGPPMGEVIPGPLSGLDWSSGAHVGNDADALAAFENWRGRPVDLAMFFVDRTVGWPGLLSPGWLIDLTMPVTARLVLAEPLYPEGEGNNQDCAAGDYDDQWRMLGPYLEQRGRGDAIIRLGWGFNDVAHPWRADEDPADWVACFQRVSAAIREGGPGIEIAWEFNPQGRADTSDLDPYAAYPGDDYVDYIGIEAFDREPPATTEAEWQAVCEAPSGLCSVIDFARAHGKRLGLSEWGVVSCDAAGGGDNAFWVGKMFSTFVDNRDVMGFELYYQDAGGACSALSTGDQNPAAAAAYRALYTAP